MRKIEKPNPDPEPAADEKPPAGGGVLAGAGTPALRAAAVARGARGSALDVYAANSTLSGMTAGTTCAETGATAEVWKGVIWMLTRDTLVSPPIGPQPVGPAMPSVPLAVELGGGPPPDGPVLPAPVIAPSDPSTTERMLAAGLPPRGAIVLMIT
jgi:hypothetical protein